MKQAIRYSEAFKQHVLSELESGRFRTVEALRRAYGIRGLNTISNWAVKYGSSHPIGKVVRVETAKEVSELQRLRKKVKVLESALATERIDHMLSESYLRIACRRAGIDDVDDFKKKHAGKV